MDVEKIRKASSYAKDLTKVMASVSEIKDAVVKRFGLTEEEANQAMLLILME